MSFVKLVSAIGIMLGSVAHAQTCTGDLTGDGQVNGADLAVLLTNWGICPATITAVSPALGGTQGGTVLSISGTGLSSTTSVRIGGVPCTAVTVISQAMVRATTPPGSPGQAAIAVTTAGGTTLALAPFTYVQQQVSSVEPSAGPYQGGTSITIIGEYLAGTTSVTIGGIPCTNVVSVDANRVTAVTPPGSLGSMDVVVTCPKGTVTAPGAYTYLNLSVPGWATLVEALPNAAVVTDPALRSAIVATGLAWRVRDTATQVEMLLVPPGTFQMGCSQGSVRFPCASQELPVHAVTLTNAFYLGRFEVTQGQWQARMGSNPSFFQGASYPDAALRPVEQVSWTSLQGFLSLTGLRLPTEAEWEFACRAGTTSPFHNGSNDDSTAGTIAWYGACCGGNAGLQTHVAGGRLGNRLGFHDMLGNVQEWVNDWFAAYASGAQTNPAGPAGGTARVLRGGSWYNDTDLVRSSFRNSVAPGTASDEFGFRVARNP